MPKLRLYARAALALTVLPALTATVPGVSYAQPPPCTACIAVAIAPGQSLLVSEPLNGLEVVVRTGEGRGDPAAAVSAIAAAGGRPGLWLPAPDVTVPPEVLRQVSRVFLDVTSGAAGDEALAFGLKTALTHLRALKPDVVLGVVAPPALLAALAARDVTPYLDVVAVPGAGGAPPFPPAAGRLHAAGIYPASAALPLPAATAWLLPLPPDAIAARRLLDDIARTSPVLAEGLVPGGMVDVHCGGRRVASFLNPASLDTIAIVPGCTEDALAIAPGVPGTSTVRLSGGELVVRVPPLEGHFAEGVRVVGARRLGVREIIARHQAAAARQQREIRQLISTGRMTLTFEAPGFPAPMAITSQAIIFSSGSQVEIEQRDVRVNGIAFQGGRVPRLPLLEPERVASPPLAIALTDVYRYALDGEERVAGVLCYVVSFDPSDADRSLYAGRAWIAADTFQLVRISAVQTRLRGPIVSSEQTDEFRPAGPAAWLLSRSEVHQIYEGAGHRTPIHRVLSIDAHDINPKDFAGRQQAAYASTSIILRETPDGFRYLDRQPEPGASAGARIVPTVTGSADRVRTVAVGVILDPNISRPLPFAGLSYVDFDLFGTGTQVNGFFGGTYGQVAMAVPSLAGTRWQLAGRAFGIASSYNDRAFVEGREIYAANVAQRPAHASAWLLRPLSSRITLRAGYDFDFTHYGSVESTAASFRVPAAQAAHGLRLALEGQWAGWTASGWWVGARRSGWREWGEPAAGEYDPAHRDYQRFGLVLARSVVVSPRLVGRLEGTWMAGRDLDRFSRYSFGSFDNRLRGYPSALIRYDRGGVFRAAGAWASGRFLRIDGFLDTAYVRDPGFGRGFAPYSGIGLAAEVPAPFGTLAAIEWGYGFQGVNSDGSRGTHVVRISGYKMF